MIDTATIEFGVSLAEAALALTAAGMAFGYRSQRNSARADRDRLAEHAECAQANIEALRNTRVMLSDAVSVLASDLADACVQLDRINADRATATERRRAHMRELGIRGNKSPKRRVSRAKAA